MNEPVLVCAVQELQAWQSTEKPEDTGYYLQAITHCLIIIILFFFIVSSLQQNAAVYGKKHSIIIASAVFFPFF